MVECSYCGETFADEDAYLDHLEAAHAGELGPIDRRRVEGRHGDDGNSSQLATYAIAGGAVLIVLGVLWIAMGTLGDEGYVHEHGTLVVEIDGEPLDLDQATYRAPDRFHFHSGDGTTWHMHPDRLPFAEAMEELGLPVTETSITVDGTTYDDADGGTSVTMLINGEPADLDRDLHDGDAIEITVETDG